MAKPVLNAPDNGIPHRGFSGQIYGKLPDLTTALQIASEYEFVSSQATGGAAAEWLAGFANEMLDPTQHVTVSGITYSGKAALILSVYDKGVVWDGATLPAYMQATPAFQMQAGPLMQPTRVGSPAVSGYTEWGDYHAHVRSKPRLDAANALYATTPYRSMWADTMGPDTLHGQQWWAGSGHTAGTAISPADWVTQEKTVLTKMATALGSSVYLACNGVRPQAAQAAGGGAFFHLIDVCDLSLWENWGNAGGSIGVWCSITTASTARPSDAQWKAMCQAALDVQLAGKDFHGLVTYAATSVSAGGTALRAAEEFLTATLLLASNGSAGGHALFEIALGGTAQTAPWTNGELTNPLYDAFTSGGSSVLGNPLDHYADIGLAAIASSASGALYQRAYTNGYVLYNSGTTALSSPLDGRNYTDLFTGATVGSNITVAGGQARFLHTTGVVSTDTTPPVVTITTPATATLTAPPGATSQVIAGTITDDVLVDHVTVQNQTTGDTVTDSTLNASGGGGGGTGSAQTTCYWGAALTENLDANFWSHLHAEESSAELNRLFASVRKNYGPDNTPIISAALTQAWNEGRYFQYQNGKPNPNTTYDKVDANGNANGGTYWRSVANGHYDSVYIAFFEAVRTAGMWTNGNPLNYSFHHEQYVTSEGGGANYGTSVHNNPKHFKNPIPPRTYVPSQGGGPNSAPAADYIAFHRHVYNLLVNGGGGHGPWHVSVGGNIRVSFVPHWRQFYEDATYGSAAASGGVVGYTFSDLNPGAAYYEIIGADIYSYNGDNWTAAQQWTPVHKAALAMGKPIVTGETGVAADNGDTYVVNYLNALDALLKGWAAGWGAGQILGINWTNRVVNTPGKAGTPQALSDLNLDATPAILAKYKAMAHDPFYSAVATPTSDGSQPVGPPGGSSGTFSVAIPISPAVASGSNAIKVIGFDSSGNPSTAKFRTIIAQAGASGDIAPPVITLQTPAEPLPKRPVRGISFPNPPSAAEPPGYTISSIPALTCYLNWSDLQTAQGSAIGGAGLTKLNAYITWARSVGGIVKLRLFCNGSWVGGARDSGAPDWLKASVGTFRHLNSQDQNPTTDPALVLARYWRPGAVTAYESLIGPLAQLVDGVPEIREVSVSGAMMLYAEPFILDLADPQNRAELVGGGTGWAASGAAGVGGVAVAVPGAGFTDASHKSAIQQAIDIHAKYFQNTASAVTYNPYQVLLSKAEAVAAGKTNTYTNDDQYFTSTDEAGIPNTKAMIDYAVNALGDRAVLENHSARPDYFNYDASGNASSINNTTPYGLMFAYMVAKNGPIFIQTANSTQITNPTYPDVGVAFAKTMDAVINLLFAAGVEPPQDFQTLAAQGHSQFSAAQFASYTAALQANPTSRGRTTSASVSIPSTQTTYSIQVQVEDPDSGVASVSIDGVTVTPTAPNVYAHTVNVASGTHSYQIVAKDVAGNQSTATAVVTRAATLVDYTPPALTATLRNAAGTDVADDVIYAVGTTTVTVRGTAADESGGSGLAGVTVNGVAVAVAADGTYSKAVTVGAGSNPVKVVATDNAGNARSITRTAQVTAHLPPRLVMASPTGDGTVPTDQTSELVSGKVTLGDSALATVKVNGTTVLSGGAGGVYAGRFGSDHGGGYANIMAVDALNPLNIFVGGDTWGQRISNDGGNIFRSCEKGRTSKEQSRAAAWSKRPTTSGTLLLGVGNFQTPGSGRLAYVLPGDNQPHDIDTTNGFGGPWGGGGAGTGIAASAKRACDDMIVCDYDSAGDKQYIYTITNTGLHRYIDGGATMAAVTGPTNLATAAQLGNLPQYLALLLIDSNHLVVCGYDQVQAPGTSGNIYTTTSMWMVTSSGSTNGLRNATSGQLQITKLTIPVGHVYDLIKGDDGHFYAACAYDGVYEIALSGNNLTWTNTHCTNDVIVSGVTVAPDRTIWATQAGGNLAGTFDNDSTGTPANHAIMKGVFSGGAWTWSYALATATVGNRVFRPGDGATATGDIFWMSAANINTILTGAAFDGAMIRLKPGDPNTIIVTGRSGQWQSRDGGAHWYPAMRGLNGTQVLNGVVTNNGAGQHGIASADVSDWKGIQTSDHWNTVTQNTAGQIAGGKGTTLPSTAGATKSYVGDDGNTYLFTMATAGGSSSITKKVGANPAVEIGDEGFRGAFTHPAAMAVDSDGTVYMAQYGGGIYVLELSTSGFSTTMALAPGVNHLAVVATDANGLTTEFDATIVRPPAIIDTQAPSVTYNAPIDPVTLSAGVANGTTSINISGHAADDSGTVSTFTIAGAGVTIAGDGSWSKTLSGLVVGSNTFQVVATDPTGNTYTATLTITRAAVGATPSVLITTADPQFVAAGVTSIAIAGIATAPGGSVTKVEAWADSDVSHVTASLGAISPARCLTGIRLGDQSAAAGQQTYPGGLDAFQSLVGVKFGLNSYGDVWDFGSAEITQMQTDIAAGRVVYFEWAPPAATALSPADQIANGSQDSVITAKINLLKPLGGTIYLRMFQGFGGGALGTPTSVIAAWQHIVGMFRTAGVTNVKFVFCGVNADFNSGDVATYWPGDTWVDIVGIEAYNTVAAGYVSPQTLYQPANVFAFNHGLSMMICQSGSEEFSVASGPGSKAQWILDLGTYIKQISRVIGWAYRSSVFAGSDLRLDSSPSALAAYETVVQDPVFNPNVAWTATVPNLQAGSNIVQAMTTDNNAQVSPRDSITVNRSTGVGVPQPQPPSPQLTDTTAAGRFTVGDTLHITAGGFTNGPITQYQFRWYRGTTGTPFRTILSATPSDSYTAASADVGQPIRVDVIATNATGPSSPVSSASSPIIQDVPSVPTPATTPTVSDIG